MHKTQEISTVTESGETAIFKELFDQYRDIVYHVALKMLKSESQAEDVVQDVFLKIWISRDQISGISNFKAYLFTIVRNTIYNLFRKQANANKYLRDNFIQTVEVNDIDDKVFKKEASKLLHEAMMRLTPQQQKVFELSRFDGLKYKEIGSLLNISKETVKKHIIHATEEIKKYIESNQQNIFNLLFLYFWMTSVK